MNCLNCSTEMINHMVLTKKNKLLICYDTCEACGSFWLDAGELDKMAYQVDGSIEASSSRSAEGVSEPVKNCPRCDDTELTKIVFIGYSDIVLDHCRNCSGFWLDGGELDLINKQLKKIMTIKGTGLSEFVSDIHLPYWYRRVKRKSSETDFVVEVPPIKGATLTSQTNYLCPSCDERLNLYEVFGVEIEGCPKCKGVLFDSGELRKLKDRSERGPWTTLRWMDDEVEAIENAQAMVSNRLCPKCKEEKFLSTNFGDSSIIIDWCSSCHSTWLDKNEFQEIIEFLKEKLNNLSVADMRRKLSEEVKEVWSGPEDKWSEILDAKAALWALTSITIFDQPKLYKKLLLLRSSQLVGQFGSAVKAYFGV